MKTIFVVIFLIHCSHQYDIEHGDKSDTYTSVDDFSGGNWRIYSNVPLNGRSQFFRNENGDEVILKQPRTNIQDHDQIVSSKLVSKNQGLYRSFKYSTSKGTVREETITHNADVPSFSGKSSYVGDDGIRYIFSYVADSNGYRPKVLFGKNVIIEIDDKLQGGFNYPTPTIPFSIPIKGKGVGSNTLICSLIGGGCL